jgi:hypothetical protein
MSIIWEIANRALAYTRVRRNYALANKFILLKQKYTEADAQDLAVEYLKICDKYDSLSHEFITMLTQSARLEAENEFMLRLINEYKIGE